MESEGKVTNDVGSGAVIGVVIRTLNEAELIGTCLETLCGQRSDFDLDILVVDSGSTDATLEIVRSHGVRIFSMPPAEFDYSSSLNVGIERVRGELVLIVSAHAIPVDDQWVARMAAPFDDPNVAGVASRQLPWADAPWQEVVRLGRQFGGAKRVYSRGNPDGLVFSNAASCLRRSVWREEPFTLPAAEDHEWAQRVLSAGRTIVYEPAAAVYHSHHESARAQARRLIDLSRAATSETGPRPLRRTLREAAGLLYRDSRAIVGLSEPPSRKLVHLAELVRVVAYYVLDFSRSGTTAERRRQDA